MKSIIKAFMLFLAFSMQIHVKASSSKRYKAGELTLLESCTASSLGHQLDCFAINTSATPVVKDFRKVQVFVRQKGVFSAAGAQVKWIQGEGAIKATEGAEITTTFGSALCEGQCVAAFSKSEENLEFHALKGEWNLISFGEKDRVPLAEGGSIKIARVSNRGTSEWSLPYTVSLERFERMMTDLFSSHISDQERQDFTKSWKGSVESLSQLYQGRASRQIASHNQERARRARALKAVQEEERALRELFRQKTLLE